MAMLKIALVLVLTLSGIVSFANAAALLHDANIDRRIESVDMPANPGREVSTPTSPDFNSDMIPGKGTVRTTRFTPTTGFNTDTTDAAIGHGNPVASTMGGSTPTPDFNFDTTDAEKVTSTMESTPFSDLNTATPDPAPRPPDSVNPPRKITFDYETGIDFENFFTEDAVDIEVGSQEDLEASRWLVATSSGYEYDGSPDILEEIFINAKLPPSDSIDEIISRFGEPKIEDVSETSPGLDVRSKRDVHGEDTRLKVHSPASSFPWSAIGQVTFLNCTGVVVGPRHILTAGHCVYNRATQRWRGGLSFFRGKDCDPDIGTHYNVTNSLAVRGWTEYGYLGYDIGMIVVDQVIDSSHVMNFGHLSKLYSYGINIAGYPGDKPHNCLWRTGCNILSGSNHTMAYKCDTSGGMSGGPVYILWPGPAGRVIYCVHTYGGKSYNHCTRITHVWSQILQIWISDY